MANFEFTEQQLKKFEEDGYLVIENFYSSETCDRLRQECSRLIDEMNPADHPSKFSTDDHEQMKEEYFLTSGDKIRYFWEAEAYDENGVLNRPKHKALNKIGHALHFLNSEFKEATFSPKLEVMLRKMGFKKPAIPQSMYIFKQPHIGGTVMKHIDATFLESVPSKLTGFWIALEDATLENGCLYFAPGSHKDAEVTYRMVRNPDKQSKQIMYFEGKFAALPDDKYVPVPVKKGSMILIDGMVQHMSAKNLSDKSRHIYTFHVTETYKSEWSERNWLISIPLYLIIQLRTHQMKLIGPKCSVCCNLISIWAMIMLTLMGVFFSIKSPALYNDIQPINQTQINQQSVVYAAYDEAAKNCYIAAGIYVIVFVFSLWQWKVNRSLQAYTVR